MIGWAAALPGFLLALHGLPVAAQITCGDRYAMVEQLSRVYGEARQGGGLANPTAIFEVWASCDTGSWTILKTYPSGMACLIAVGENWQGAVCEEGTPI